MPDLKTYPCHHSGMMLPAASLTRTCIECDYYPEEIPLSYAETGESCAACGGALIIELAPYCSCGSGTGCGEGYSITVEDDPGSVHPAALVMPIAFILCLIVFGIPFAPWKTWLDQFALGWIAMFAAGVVTVLVLMVWASARRYFKTGFDVDQFGILIQKGLFRKTLCAWEEIESLQETFFGVEIRLRNGKTLEIDWPEQSEVGRWVIREKLFPLARKKGVTLVSEGDERQ